MANLTPDIPAQLVKACEAGVGEAAAAIGRALDAEVNLKVGQHGTVDVATLPQWMGGPGLVVVLVVGDTGALLLIPEDSGILPAWCAQPDATGQSRLATLAQELGVSLLPEQFAPTEAVAAYVKSLSGSAARGGVVSGAGLIPLQLRSADRACSTAALVWPVANASAVLGVAKGKSETGASPTTQAKPDLPAADSAPVFSQKAHLDSLPPYAKSLLRIKVPVVAILAQKRQPLGHVIELGPGSIIQFDKSCEEMLELDVGDRLVATGEAVKVGDKFGLRIKSVLLPEERFQAVQPREKARPGSESR